MIARFIDTEGVTWREIAVVETPPTMKMLVARTPDVFGYNEPDVPGYSSFIKEAMFRRERTTGDGVVIYRLMEP